MKTPWMRTLFAITMLAGTARAQITISGQDLLDDPYFTGNPGVPDSSSGIFELWRHLVRSPAEDSDVQLVVGTNTSVAGNNDSFMAPINIATHPAVTNLPYYDVNQASLTSIQANFTPDDWTFFSANELYQTNQPSAAQAYNGWYVITLDTVGGTFTATSGVENIMTPTAANNVENFTILSAAWNVLTWDTDPFAGGGVAYTNINDIRIEFFYTNEVPITTDAAAFWNFRHVSVSYDVAIDAVDLDAPAAPTGLTATGFPQRIDLAWDANTEVDLASYNLARSTTSGTGYAVFTNLLVTAFTDTNVVANTDYYYVVQAVDFADNVSSNSLEASASTTDLPPSAPTNLTAAAGNTQVTLDWDDNVEAEQDLASYSVYRSLISGSGYARVASNLVAGGYVDGGLANGTPYYYVVTAVDVGGQESGFSDEANATPENLTLIFVPALLGWHSPDHVLGEDYTPDLPVAGVDTMVDGIARQYDEGLGDGSIDDTLGTVPIPVDSLPTVTNSWALETSNLNRSRLIVTLTNNTSQVLNLDTIHLDFAREADTENPPTNLVVSYFGGDLGLIDGTTLYTTNGITNIVNAGGADYSDADIDLTGLADFQLAPGERAQFQILAVGGGGGNRNSLYIDNLGFSLGLGVFTNLGASYSGWIGGFGLSGSPDADPGYDFDADGWVNLYEYGLGGNPTSGVTDVSVPSFGETGGALTYTHAQRADDTSLLYYLELTEDLVTPTWTNQGYSVLGTNVTGGELDFVTNSVPGAAGQEFIRLIIEQN